MPAKAPSLLQDLRSLPGAFRVLFAGTFVYPFLTIFLTERGMSPEQVYMACWSASTACWSA